MPTRTRRTALGLAVLAAAATAPPAAAQQPGPPAPAGPAARTFLPPRQPGSGGVARAPSVGSAQAQPGVPPGVPLPYAAPHAFQMPFNPGFLPPEPPPELPPLPANPPRPPRPGFQFNPGWGIGPAGGFGQPLIPSLLPAGQGPPLAAVARPAGAMVLEREGSRFYRVAGSELFYSPSARVYLDPQTGLVSRPAVAGRLAAAW